VQKIRELNNGLVKANTEIKALVESILTSLNSSQASLLPRARQGRKVSAKTRKSRSLKIFAKPTHNGLEMRRSLR